LKKNTSLIISIFLTVITIFIITSCANIVSPTGGPRDTEAPKIINSLPENYSINFSQKRIEINFNEFIVLKDLRSQLIISPPFKELPEIKTRGKSLIIDFEEDLKENTTYTIYLGDAITDLTEGNAVPSYEFVFSTGNVVDSLTITGKVKDAFTLKPEKDVFVMLYDNLSDSVPYKEAPYYMAKTKEDGSFTLNNLRNLPYKIFAIKDINNNYKFDQIVEKIAFADSLVTPHFRPIVKKDNIQKDSLKISKINPDTLRADSIKQMEITNKLLSIKDLHMFYEIDSTQKILRAEFKSDRKILIEFKFPNKNLKYKIIDNFENENWKIDDISKNRDSITFWLLKPDIDSLALIIDNGDKFIDTLHIYQNKKPRQNPKFIISSNLNPSFNYFDKITFYTEYPVLSADSFGVQLYQENDTLNTYAYVTDEFHRQFQIKKELKQNKPYKIYLNEKIIKDISNAENDSLIISFKTNSQEDLGNFRLNINTNDTTDNFIIQLLTEKEEFVKQAYIKQNAILNFKNLNPGNYLIKAIRDKNPNFKWDTGNYLKKQQAEEVYFFPTKIIIRANWDLEESWTL